MPRTASILAYTDVIPYLDQAMAAETGIRILVPDKSAAINLVARLNTYRVLDRKRNAEVYAGTTSPLRNSSAYDILIFRRREVDGKWRVIIDRPQTYAVEEL